MRTETITIYKFHELPTEEAKERAREWWREGWQFDGKDELDSITKFCEHFNAKLRDWQIAPFGSFDFTTNANNDNFRGRRLRQFSRHFMPTGYYLDCDLWVTFYDEFKRTGDAKHAFNEAIYKAFSTWRNDMEWQLSDECIDENLICNEYEFLENGEPA